MDPLNLKKCLCLRDRANKHAAHGIVLGVLLPPDVAARSV
jgi:hypothetical protein